MHAPRGRKRKSEAGEAQAPKTRPPSIWLKAEYIAHIFHYRMPETVAIVAVNPIVPSPLTIKMAMIASLLREGREADAQRLLEALPWIKTKICPPEGAIAFKAFMRYARPPKAGTTELFDTGSSYTISPHIREYALWSSPLIIYTRVPKESENLVSEALSKIPYLGAKDSLMTCLNVEKAEPPEGTYVTELASDLLRGTEGGFIVRLADFNLDPEAIPEVIKLIPTQREEDHYKLDLYWVPGELHAAGKVKIYRRDSDAGRSGHSLPS